MLLRIKTLLTQSVVARGSLLSAVVMVIGKVLSYVVNIAFVRVCGPVAYGIYIYYMAWIGVLAVIVRLGLDTVLLKFVSQYNVKCQWGLLKGLLWKSHLLVGQLLCVVGVLGGGYVIFFERRLGFLQIKNMITAFVIIWLIANISLVQSSLRSFGSIVYALIPDMVCRPLVMMLFLFLFVGTGMTVSSSSLLGINAVALTVTLLILGYFFVKTVPGEFKSAAAEFATHEWLKIGIPFLLLGGINLIMNKTDLLMVGFFLSSDKVAVYSACVDLSSIMLFVLTAVGMVMVPLLSRLHIEEKYEQIVFLMKSNTRWLAAVSFSALVLMILFGRLLLNVYDESFSVGYSSLVILSIGFAINVSVGLVGALLNMAGREILVTRTVGMCAVLNVILNFLLIPSYGIVGAAMATSISMSIWNIFLFVYVHKVFLPTIALKSLRVGQ